MRKINARTNFNFNGKWLSEFGATLYNASKEETQNILAESRHNVKEISLVDGGYYTGRTFEPLIIPLDILFTEEFDVDELVEWLSVEDGGWLYFKDEERKIEVVLNSGINITSHFRENGYCGKLSIEMIAYEPHWYEVEPRFVEIQNPVRGQDYGFYNDGNLPSRPTIELKCVGEKTNFAIAFNGYEIEIDKFMQNIKIDTKYGTVTTTIGNDVTNKYSSYKLKGGYHEREMIFTEPGIQNNFRVIRGDVTEIKVTPNIKWKS